MRSCTSSSADLHTIESHGKINRQKCNEAFNLFIKSLHFSNAELVELFSYPVCESTRSDGTRILDDIVMDGTAAGILGELPKFERPDSTVLEASRSVVDRQYIITSASLPEFVKQ